MPLIVDFKGFSPQVAEGVFLADNVTLAGDIAIGELCNIWYGCVLRGDVGRIVIGQRVNIQDLCCIHMTKHKSESLIADDVSIGHSVVVHGAIIDRAALIGMGSVLMDNARVGEEAILGAGSLLTPGTIIPPRTLALGRPARVVRDLRPDEWGAGKATSLRYLGLASEHAKNQPPPTK